MAFAIYFGQLLLTLIIFVSTFFMVIFQCTQQKKKPKEPPADPRDPAYATLNAIQPDTIFPVKKTVTSGEVTKKPATQKSKPKHQLIPMVQTKRKNNRQQPRENRSSRTPEPEDDDEYAMLENPMDGPKDTKQKHLRKKGHGSNEKGKKKKNMLPSPGDSDGPQSLIWD